MRSWQERFEEKIQRTEGCWVWTAYVNPGGYGRFGKSKTDAERQRHYRAA